MVLKRKWEMVAPTLNYVGDEEEMCTLAGRGDRY